MRLFFRILTGDLRDGFINRKERSYLIVIRFLFGIPLFTAIVLYIWFPQMASWSYFPLPLYLRILGIGFGFFALYILYQVHQELGIFFSSSLVIKEGHRLITSGPYSLVRHPMYTSYLLLFLAAFLLSENWLIGLTGKGIIISLMTLRLRKEEELLLDYFGVEYEEYQKKTGMFLPVVQKGIFWKKAKEILLP